VMADMVGASGEVGVVTLPNQLNHQERTRGFRETMSQEFPNIRVVSVSDGKGDRIVSREAAAKIIETYPNVVGIFNTDAVGGVGVADAVRLTQRQGKLKVIAFDT